MLVTVNIIYVDVQIITELASGNCMSLAPLFF